MEKTKKKIMEFSKLSNKNETFMESLKKGNILLKKYQQVIMNVSSIYFDSQYEYIPTVNTSQVSFNSWTKFVSPNDKHVWADAAFLLSDPIYYLHPCSWNCQRRKYEFNYLMSFTKKLLLKMNTIRTTELYQIRWSNNGWRSISLKKTLVLEEKLKVLK